MRRTVLTLVWLLAFVGLALAQAPENPAARDFSSRSDAQIRTKTTRYRMYIDGGLLKIRNTNGTTTTIVPGGGGGTVSSVALALPASVFSISGSPVIGSGTLTGTFLNQTANTIFAGPGNGAAAAPAFRALVAADIPAHTQTSTSITDFVEAVDDRVGALLVAGANVTLTYDDAGNTLTVAASGGGGGGSPGGANTQIQYNDAGAFNGDASLVWNETMNALGVGRTPGETLFGDTDTQLLILGGTLTNTELSTNYFHGIRQYTILNGASPYNAWRATGIRSELEIAATATATYDAFYGAEIRATQAGGTTNWVEAGNFTATVGGTATTGGVIGGEFEAVSGVGWTNGSAGMTGASAGVYHNAATVITDVYGLRVDNMANSGTFTNTYGLHIGDVTAGTQTNQAYGLYQADANARNFFAGDVTVPTEVYGAGWNGSSEVPTKDALYDKIETLGGGGSPGGVDTQVQFNDGGAFGGDADLAWNKTSNTLTMASSGSVKWSTDLAIYRDAANVLAVTNGSTGAGYIRLSQSGRGYIWGGAANDVYIGWKDNTTLLTADTNNSRIITGGWSLSVQAPAVMGSSQTILSDNVLTSFATVPCPTSGQIIGGHIVYTVEVTDETGGSANQAESGIIPFIIQNEGGTVRATIYAGGGGTGALNTATIIRDVDAGTLSNVFSTSVAGTTVTFKITSDTSITADANRHRLRWRFNIPNYQDISNISGL